MTPHVRTPGWGERAAPLVEAGLLTLGEVHVVDRLSRLGRESRPDVLLGLAFAVRAPRVGHAGVRLDDLAASLKPEAPASPPGAAPTRPAPEVPGPGWHALVATSPLVGPGHPFVASGSLLQTHRLASYEARLARALVARCELLPGGVASTERLAQDLAAQFPGSPPEHPQRLAGLLALTCRTAVITGGPGTGKTTTVARVLRLVHGQAEAAGRAPPRVALAAPTGKAAARLRESLAAAAGGLPSAGVHRGAVGEGGPASDAAGAWIGSLSSVTLHRLLGYNPGHPSRPTHHPGRRLPYDLVIVDEASMIDVALMCKLVEAVSPEARLILLGDRHQLASVEAGSVLGDLALAVATHGVTPDVQLPPPVAEAVAQVGGEAAVAGRVRANAPRLAGSMVAFSQAFRFEVEALRVPIYALADASREPLQEAAHLERALAALGNEGPGPVRRVNHAKEALDATLLDEVVATYAGAIAPLRAAPAEPEAWRTTLRSLDDLRVLTAHRDGPLGVSGLNRSIAAALRAPRDAEPWWTGRVILVTENDYEANLWNGDVGVVTRVNRDWVAVFSSASGPRSVPVAALPAHESAFAMTIHKSQGSQFAHAVVVLPTEVTQILTRELVYTGISRARSRLTVAGSLDVLRRAVNRRVRRESGLAGRLAEAEAALSRHEPPAPG